MSSNSILMCTISSFTCFCLSLKWFCLLNMSTGSSSREKAIRINMSVHSHIPPIHTNVNTNMNTHTHTHTHTRAHTQHTHTHTHTHTHIFTHSGGKGLPSTSVNWRKLFRFTSSILVLRRVVSFLSMFVVVAESEAEALSDSTFSSSTSVDYTRHKIADTR